MPLRTSASRNISACDGGTTGSSSPCSSSTGQDSPSTMFSGARARVEVARLGQRADQAVEVARLEVVGVLGEPLELGDAEQRHPAGEHVGSAVQRGQHGPAAGRAALDREPSPVGQVRLGKADARRPRVLDVHHPPLPAQPVAVLAAVPVDPP